MTPTGTTISVPVAVPAAVSVLAPYVEEGIFGPFEVQLAATMARLVPTASAEELLGVAIAARAPRFGHVCAELDRLPSALAGDGDRAGAAVLPWPAPEGWVVALAGSPLVSTPGATHHRVRPLVWDGSRLYLQRYWRDENAVATDLTRRARPARRGRTASPDTLSQFVVEKALDGLFGPDNGAEPDLQRLAARRALTPGISIIAGGPGTGKTRTIARLLALAHLAAAAEGESLVVALAAPTGKAAQRMTEALRAEVPLLEQSGTISASLGRTLTATDATTIHRLLQWRPGPRYLHDRRNPLPHQLVIVDETSMVSLPLMARLLDAVRTGARLVLVGDPYQLASIEAGTVLADVVGPVGDEGDVQRDDHADQSADRSSDQPAIEAAIARRSKQSGCRRSQQSYVRWSRRHLCPRPSCPVRPGHRASSHAPLRCRLVDRPSGRGRPLRRRRRRHRPPPVWPVGHRLGRRQRPRRSAPSSPSDRLGGRRRGPFCPAG